MKLTKSKLTQIIKEELQKLLREQGPPEGEDWNPKKDHRYCTLDDCVNDMVKNSRMRPTPEVARAKCAAESEFPGYACGQEEGEY